MNNKELQGKVHDLHMDMMIMKNNERERRQNRDWFFNMFFYLGIFVLGIIFGIAGTLIGASGI